MRADSSYPRRKPLRLTGLDYRTPGAYFVTVVTDSRLPRFGFVDGQGAMVVNELGRAVVEEWLGLTATFPAVSVGEFVVMPNHVHGIGWVLEPDAGIALPSLADVVGRFKSRTNRAHLRLASERGERSPRLWQRGYHDRVIRNDRELENATAYIATNPGNWRKDRWYIGQNDDP